MSTDVQPTVPAGRSAPVPVRNRLTRSLGRGFTLLGTLILAGTWVAIWGSLAVSSAGNEGLWKGIILGSYTVLPVFGYLGWRLYRGVRSR